MVLGKRVGLGFLRSVSN